MPQKSFTWRSRRIRRSRKDRFEWGAALIATVAVSAILTSAEAAAIGRNIKEETKPIIVQTLEIREEEPKAEPVVEIVEEVQTYDIPLDDEFQLFVIDLCEENHIDPAVVFAMMYRESGFNAAAVGDKGNSLGLLQIQPRWHEERMARLECFDLLDPEQNITVSVDLLAELLEKYEGNIEMALTAYNMGCSGAYKNCFQYGKYSSSYSEAVLAYAEELKGGEEI